jgi:dienelactone hydrolase
VAASPWNGEAHAPINKGTDMLQYFATLLLIKALSDASFYASYDPAVPLNVEIVNERMETNELSDTTFRRTTLYFDTTPGERLPVILTRPETGDGPFPCIVFLHGIGQSKGFIDEICGPFNASGFAMITYDQLMQGERKLPSDTPYLIQGKAFRKRAAATVIDARRVVDYLESRPDIDADRIYLVGASYGAITGSTATAQEERFKAAVLIYGGGDLEKLLNAPLIRENAGRWLDIVIPVAKFFLGVSDPVQYVAGISPRPVLFQGGSQDQLVAPEAVQALYDAAQEPKEITWYESDHIGLDIEVVKLVLNEALEWLRARDRDVLRAAA